MPAFKIIIVGGGLSGALLANGLRRRSIDYMVYEKEAHNSVRDGYQIRLGSPALAGFRTCLDEEHFSALMKKFAGTGGFVAEAPIFYDPSFNCLIDLTKFPAYPKTAPINRVLLRDFLTKPINDDKRLQYSKKFVKYEVFKTPDNSQRVRVLFEDGTTDECDLLIAADGSRSKINSQIGCNSLVQLTKEWGFLGKCKLPIEKIRELTPTIRGAPVGCMTCCHERKVMFFAVYMPEVKEPGQSHEDDGLASVFWGLTVPAENVPGNDGTAIPDKLQFCVDQLKSWDPRYRALLRMVNNDGIYAYQARASKEPPANWRQTAQATGDISRGSDRVWLIGDAIHPMLPSRGMGGNQAMRDTYDIIQSIESLYNKSQGQKLTPADFSNAVREYEAKMIPRAFGWVRTSGALDGDGFPNPKSWKGAVIFFLVARALDLMYLYTSVRKALTGWVPDQVPDLPKEMDLSK